jgi:hypothetical protein
MTLPPMRVGSWRDLTPLIIVALCAVIPVALAAGLMATLPLFALLACLALGALPG